MGLFHFWSSRQRSPGRQGKAAPKDFTPPLCVERLESRTLLDASAALTGGILYVLGGLDKNRIDLSLDKASSQIVVRDAGKELGRFASGNVSGIAIATGPGDDRVRVAQNILQPATIQAGNGNVILQAGGGATTLIAGDGNDRLIGNAGTTVFQVGNGNSMIISRGAHDIIQVGFGQNRIFVRGNDALIGVGPQDRVYGRLITSAPADPPPADIFSLPPPATSPDPPGVVLQPGDVQTILERASAATPSEDAIVAIVDRQGNVLGVRVGGNVSTAITGNPEKLVFAIDGALAEARTGAFFGNDQAPLTSRTIQFISQSTITQREVQSDPNIPDPNSTLRGPGFVAPIGVGGHFPPNIMFTPQVDLFGIENTNRDSIQNPGPDGIKGTPDDVTLPSRFNVPTNFIPAGQGMPSPESYGFITQTVASAQSRGIGTLPGGIPIFLKNPANGQLVVVGGIGVFFPGTTGFASEENSQLSANYDPTKPDRSLEAELIAFTAIGGSSTADSPSRPAGSFDFHGPIGDAPAISRNFDLPAARIDLVGISLDVFGPGGRAGPDVLIDVAHQVGFGGGHRDNGFAEPIAPNTAAIDASLLDPQINPTPPPNLSSYLTTGKAVPEGWLVTPHPGAGLTADDVIRIVGQGINEANQVRAAIRAPLDSLAKMVFAVSDKQGNILGLYRMPDATVFSIDVAVAKARNVAYYADPTQLQPADQVPGVPPGVSFTNRTFRYLSEPRFPEGIDGRAPGPFSVLNDGGTDPRTGLSVGAPLPASAFTSVLGHDSFNPDTNFHQPFSLNQNGIVFFPGSTPLYKNGQLVGGLGVSGDGVDQDDDVTFFAALGYQTPPTVLRADQVTFQGVNLPFQNFNRNPVEPV